MSEKYSIYEPVAPLTGDAVAAPLRLDDLRGKTVGFVDNAKPNFNFLLFL